MIIIINDDAHYLRWIEENPDGFVVNTQNPPSPNYLVLHRSTCRNSSIPSSTKWTITDSIEVCSQDVHELRNWADRRVVGELKSCERCQGNESM